MRSMHEHAFAPLSAVEDMSHTMAQNPTEGHAVYCIVTKEVGWSHSMLSGSCTCDDCRLPILATAHAGLCKPAEQAGLHVLDMLP